MLALALVSPFAALGLLFVMQGVEGLLLGVSPDVVPTDVIAVTGMAEDDLADRTRPSLAGAGIVQPRLSAGAAQADLLGRRVQQVAAAKHNDHWRDAALADNFPHLTSVCFP